MFCDAVQPHSRPFGILFQIFIVLYFVMRSLEIGNTIGILYFNATICEFRTIKLASSKPINTNRHDCMGLGNL